jgi:uncharacterized HAD superfamily protein
MNKTLACDIDGTLTASPLHFGGYNSKISILIWSTLSATGIAKILLKRSKPNRQGVDWVKAFHVMEWRIRLVTAREIKFRDLTKRWLDKYHVPYDSLEMRPPGISIVEHKYIRVDKRGGVSLYIDDDRELGEEVEKILAGDAPEFLCAKDWNQIEPRLNQILFRK